VRAGVAMVATKASRSGRVLKLVLNRVSGELDMKIWRDKDRKPDTIKVMTEPGLWKERLEKNGESSQENRWNRVVLTVSQYEGPVVIRVTLSVNPTLVVKRLACSPPIASSKAPRQNYSPKLSLFMSKSCSVASCPPNNTIQSRLPHRPRWQLILRLSSIQARMRHPIILGYCNCDATS
jgi:hypothetical protein